MREISCGQERWLPVSGYEGRYEVSDHGRVRSLPHTTLWKNGGQRTYPGRVIGCGGGDLEYPRVTLHKDGKAKTQRVHRLVLEAFIGPAPEGMECLHGDGDPTNNNLSNLRWGTSIENEEDKLRHGTRGRDRQTHCPRGHLLVEPNLVRSATSKVCRSCHLAATKRSRLRRKHGRDLNFLEQANANYQRVMDGARG